MKQGIARYCRQGIGGLGLLLGLWGTLGIGLGFTANAQAAAWPDKPITLIVPSAAGGAADLTARVFSQYLTKKTGVNVVVEDRPGAGGIVGAMTVRRANADGYTFLLSSNSTQAANLFLYKQLAYDPVHDFIEVGLLGTFGTVCVVSASSPYHSLADLVGDARAHPGHVFYGYYSSSSEVPPALLKAQAGIQIGGASYRDITQIITDLRGGRLNFAFVDYLTAMGQVDGNALRAIAVTSEQRNPVWPTVPTTDSVYPGFVLNGWLGIAAPAGTPATIVAQMNQYIGQAVADSAIAQRLTKLGLQPKAMDQKAFDAFVQADVARWKHWVDVAGIPAQ